MHKDIGAILAEYVALPIIKQILCIGADNYMYYMRFMRISGYYRIRARRVIYSDSYGYFDNNGIIYIYDKHGEHRITYKPGKTRDRYGMIYNILDHNIHNYVYVYQYVDYKCNRRVPWSKYIRCDIMNKLICYNYDDRIDIIINFEYQTIIVNNIRDGKGYDNLSIYYDRESDTILYEIIGDYVFILPYICNKRAFIKYR